VCEITHTQIIQNSTPKLHFNPLQSGAGVPAVTLIKKQEMSRRKITPNIMFADFGDIETDIFRSDREENCVSYREERRSPWLRLVLF